MILLPINLQVLQEVLSHYSIRDDLFGKVCIIIDKVSWVKSLADFSSTLIWSSFVIAAILLLLFNSFRKKF